MIAGDRIASGNLFAEIPGSFPAEFISSLVETPALRIERIVSRGHSSPPDFWYDQPWAEWVVVLAGSAGIAFEGETSPRCLARGDYLHIPAHARHRVEWSDANEPTVWLAIHHR